MNKPQITIMDGYALNPGDIDWQPLLELGEVSIYDRTPAHLVIERCQNADMVLTNKVSYPAEILDQLPRLKYIGVLATGYNTIDTLVAREKGVIVTNIPAYSTDSVAQHTFALILALSNHVALHAQNVQQGGWVNSPDFAYWINPITELAGKTLGIVGMGQIGQKVAQIALAFDMKVIFYNRTPKNISHTIQTDLETLFKESDVISLHTAMTAENQGFINKKTLSLMKKTALIINTARGLLIHEQDLADALNQEAIAGAGLDVLSVEPPKADNPLLHAKNALITPHNAWVSREARLRLMDIAADNIKAFLQSKPMNVVN
jgi:glycerate dehydrogenase